MTKGKKYCEECMWLPENPDKEEGCRKTIYRASTNVHNNCPHHQLRHRDGGNIQRMEVDKDTFVCFDGLYVWLEQKRLQIENDQYSEEIIEIRLGEGAMHQIKEVFTHIESQLRKKK